jgi:hypothetical protein
VLDKISENREIGNSGFLRETSLSGKHHHPGFTAHDCHSDRKTGNYFLLVPVPYFQKTRMNPDL